MRLLLWECETVICFPFFEGAHVDVADVITLDDRCYDSSGRPARAIESQSKIIETARELFIEKGYSGVTIEAISRKAKVSPETIYSVFTNKRTILSRTVGLAVETDGGPVPALLRSYIQEVASERNQHR